MAVVDFGVTLGASDVDKMWKKVQGPVQQALQFDCEEEGYIEGLDPINLDFSLREVTVPLDINEDYGVGAIGEGGYEAVPSSSDLDEITLSMAEISARFTISVRSALLQNNPGAVVKKQMVFQARKKMQAVARDVSDRFYGFKLGYLAQTSTAATQASGTYTLLNMYGVAALDNAAQIADKFRVGDRVALIQSGALVTNAIGTVTAVSATTPSITVTWNGSVTSTNLDYVVKANSMENATIAGTDYDKSIVGLLDAMTSASVHGLATASQPNWAVGYSDTTGGRFSGIKWIRAKQEIMNRGGDPKKLITLFSNGVYRDMVSLEQAAVRFSDPTSMELVGDIKLKGEKVKQSRRVPDGAVLIYDQSAYRKIKLPTDERTTLTDAIRMENKAGYICPILHLRSHAVTNRRKLAYFTGLTTQ